jgi:hypothetical protein
LATAALVSCLALPLAARRAEAAEEGLQLTPSVGYARGDHRLDLSFVSRYRFESWDARASNADAIHGLRTRIGARYTWKENVSLFVQGQDARVFDLSPTGSGASDLYRANTPGADDDETGHTTVRQAYLEVRPGAGSYVRVGRQDIYGGTQVKYPEGNWNYLKMKRLGQRLVGGVGWTNGERAYDGVAAGLAIGEDHYLHAFTAAPTTGVFDIAGAYDTQEEILFGGAQWTAKRGSCLDDTEFNAFFYGYSDERDIIADDLEIYTLGASLVGVYPVGPGNADVILWAAGQWGDFPGATESLDHAAWALIAEAGYQLPDVPTKPWLRVGVNAASGDDDPDDDDHGTFFNLMPTNHLYYGYADQVAFQNLIDLFAQLKLAPHEKVGLEVALHQFWLVDDDDSRYFGSGAFNPELMGFGSAASGGENDVGTEIDVVATVKLHKHLSVAGGYSFMWGGDVFDAGAGVDGPDNTEWAFLQVLVQY